MPWRNPDLEILFGGPLDGTTLTEATMDQLVANSVQESELLDFKNDLWSKNKDPKWPGAQEFAKDVSALANHKGGVVLLGVADDHGVASATNPIPSSVDPEQEERWLRTALVNHQAPLAACDFVWIPVAAGGTYLAVIVPHSPRAPHAVVTSEDRRPIRYPLRHGQDTIWLTEPEVADRYRRRFEGQADVLVRHEQHAREGFEAIRTTNGVWLAATLTPESPAAGRLDGIVGKQIDDWHLNSIEHSPLGRHIQALGNGIAGPGRMTFTGSRWSSADDEAAVRDAYVELHVDGSAFAAVPVAFNTSHEPGDENIGEFTLVDDSILLIDHVARWAAHQAGPWGTATVTLALMDTATEDGTIANPVDLVSSDGGGLRKVQRTRSLRGGIRSTAVVDLSAVGTSQDRLAATYAAVSGIFQAFGMPEPLQLRANGGIVARQFTMSRYREVEAWANQRNVEIIERIKTV